MFRLCGKEWLESPQANGVNVAKKASIKVKVSRLILSVLDLNMQRNWIAAAVTSTCKA